MMRRGCKNTLFAALLAICLGALLVPGAGASTRQYTVIQDEGMLFANTAAADVTLDEMSVLGADMVKVLANWRSVAPDALSRTRPSVDLSDPANYNWSYLDHLVQGIESRGMTPWLVVTLPSPDWASSHLTDTKQPGVYKPDPVTFGLFVEAAAKHYPEVKYWSVLNEPNFDHWLAPQVGSKKVSLSAVHYRKLYIEARNGFQRGGAGRDEIMFGELAPSAFKPTKGAQATQPVRFLRDFFCLDDKLKPLKGSAAKARECTGKYKQIKATGFAHHPYTSTKGPQVKPKESDDAPINSLKRIYKVLDKAYSYHRLSKKKIPLWNTEFGYQSNPPDIFWTPIKRVGPYLNAAEYLSYRDPRVKSYAQYQVRDEALGSGSARTYSGFQSGLFFEDGSPKTGPLAGFQLPLVVNKTRSANRVTIWGGVRKKSSSAQQVFLQVKSSSGSYTTIKTLTLKANSRYFSTTYARGGAGKRTYRIAVGDLIGNATTVTTRVDARSN